MSSVPESSRSFPLRYLALLALIALGTPPAFAAAPAMGEHESYLQAAKQPKMQDRLRELELFASRTETTDLKIHALEMMAWYYKQLGDESNANLWAKQLLTLDPENPLGLAVLVENARRANPTTVSNETFGLAQRALRRAERFEKPEGLPDAEFVLLRQRMLGMLHGTLGYSYFQQRDYGNARNSLGKAVMFLPDDAQYVYALALASLEGSNANPNEGYWYLARAVNLTQGTPAGKQIADYAANRYQGAGGSAKDWQQFVAAAAVAPARTESTAIASARTTQSAPSSTTVASTGNAAVRPTTPAINSEKPGGNASATSTTAAASTAQRAPAASPASSRAPGASTPARDRTPAVANQPSARASSQPASNAAVPQTQVAGATVPPRPGTSAPLPPTQPATMPQSDRTQPTGATHGSSSAPAATSAPSANRQETPTEVASITAPPPAVIPRAPLSPRDPVSLGILIETAVATPENRSAVIYALVDMVRHLRSADEAFILSFGRELQFKQDLTQNYDLLEEAMSAITPDEGAALLDAVGFSSGHLARIAKHRNRVLLVISDGRDFGSRTPGYEITSQIDQSQVRIYCIGLGEVDSAGRSRLEMLSSRTGGRTTYVPDPLHFRAAAHQLAANLGIEFPM